MSYKDNVFINCPFDSKYTPLLDALVFGIIDCGFVPRCALETKDSSQFRLEKIYKIISECKYSIHDLSRVELDPKSNLPRFNMPFELGLFMGAKTFGGGIHKKKECIIFDGHRYRYQKVISDLSGMDIQSHNGRPKQIIVGTRDWLKSSSRRVDLPSGGLVYERFSRFRKHYPNICRKSRLVPEELTYPDYVNIIAVWIRESS